MSNQGQIMTHQSAAVTPTTRDRVARDSLRSTRDRVLAAVAEVYSTDKAVADLALHDANERIAALQTEIADLRVKLKAAQDAIPDTPSL